MKRKMRCIVCEWEVRPILREGGYKMLQYNREEPSPTLAEIIEIENREAKEKE